MDDYVIVPNHRSRYVDQNFKYLRSAISRQKQLRSNELKTTKYSIYNFLPLNLFEQFHRFANVYFVFIAILNFVPQVGAIDPYLALGPPIFILTVTAVKDGYENYRRYKSDREINCTLSKVYCQVGIEAISYPGPFYGPYGFKLKSLISGDKAIRL